MSKASDSTSSVVPAEVSELIQESRTVQEWLDRLASHESEASPEVFERVRVDYEGRLASVSERLAQHRSELGSSLEARQGDLATLTADRDRSAAELEEGELRHLVGEFSAEAWEEKRSGLEGSLAEMNELLASEEGAVSELAAIVGAIDEGGVPTGVELSAATAEPEDSIAEFAADLAAASDDDASDEASPKGGADDAPEGPEADGSPADEAATVESVVEEDPVETDDLSEAEVADTTEKLAASNGAEIASDVEITVEAEGAQASGESDTQESASDDEGEYLDELEFLESLSLDESDRFDAVSAMLDDEEGSKDK